MKTSSEIRYPYILHIIGKFIHSGESYMMALYFISQFNKQGDGSCVWKRKNRPLDTTMTFGA